MSDIKEKVERLTRDLAIQLYCSRHLDIDWNDGRAKAERDAFVALVRPILLAAFDALDGWQDHHLSYRRKEILGQVVPEDIHCECEQCTKTRAAH